MRPTTIPLRLPRAERRRFCQLGVGGLATLLATGCETQAMAARPSSGPNLWAQGRPKGYNVGSLDPAYHRRPYLEQVQEAGGALVRVFVDFHWDSGQESYVLPKVVEQGLRNMLEAAQQLGLELVVVGNFEQKPNPPLWGDKARADAFVAAWRGLAQRFSGLARIAGWDLLNEPNPPWTDGTVVSARREWRTLAGRTIAAIRSVDNHVPVVFEGMGGGQSIGLQGLEPFDDPHIVYSIHFYSPHAITHQQVSPEWPHAIPYPVEDRALLKGTTAFPGPWNAQRLRQAAEDARRFQLTHGLPIFVGEFSCVRWAPGRSAFNYIRDCLSMFQDYGWSYCYHEFRGWPGWDAELTSAERMSGKRSPTAPSMQLLRTDMALGR
jgi:endoglucanase